MALSTADFDRVEAARTAADARALMVRLSSEREDASPSRKSEIDYMRGMLRDEWGDELTAPGSRTAAPQTSPDPETEANAGAAPSGRSRTSSKPGKRDQAKAKARQSATKARQTTQRKAKGVGRSVVREAAGHTSSLGDIALKVAGAAVAFSLLYVLLSSSEKGGKNSVVDLITGGFASGLNAFVDATRDPLTKAPAKAPKAGTLTPGTNLRVVPTPASPKSSSAAPSGSTVPGLNVPATATGGTP